MAHIEWNKPLGAAYLKTAADVVLKRFPDSFTEETAKAEAAKREIELKVVEAKPQPQDS